jgi:hypothetical protein
VTRRLFTRLRRRRSPAERPQPVVARGLGEPSSPADADDAELDTLRGELVRELDRIAAESGGAAQRRGAARLP